NKMDLVGWSEAQFRAIDAELRRLSAQLQIPHLASIPLSALTGANVVERSAELPWYLGPTLLQHLETVPVARELAPAEVRFPVQWVIRPQAPSGELHDYRGYAGQLAGGVLRPGDDLVVLPSGQPTRLVQIEQGGQRLEAAYPGMSVTLHLADDVDLGRGDLLCRPTHRPQVSQDLEAMICWMSDRPLLAKGRYALKHTTRWTRAVVSDLVERLDVSTGERITEVEQLALNDLGRIRLRTTTPLVFDPYDQNRTTGSFILVDEATHATVAAGMLLDRAG
ncbi:MAG: elongation factor 1-alpha C-terminal domain-related protein, partial [Kofleriaceae bacterium]